MKRTFFKTLVLIFAFLILSFSLASCVKEEEIYKREDVDGFIASLNEEIETKVAESQETLDKLKAEYEAKVAEIEAANVADTAALAALKADYEAKVAAIEADNTTDEEALITLKTDYEAKVAEIETKITANSLALAALKAEHEASVAEINSKIDTEIASIEALIDELEVVDLENAEGLARLESLVEAIIEEKTQTPEKYTVTFDTDGGSAVASQTVIDGKKAKEPEAPIKTGYTFAGWYVGSEVWSFIGYSITEDITITAKWTANTYTVTFDNNGGTGGSSVTARYDSQMPTSYYVYAPSRSGYTFLGYYDSNDVQYYNASMQSVKAWDKAESATLTAKWTPNTYTVTFDKNNGTGGTNTVTATYDSAMPEATAPTRSYYTFAGYYDTHGVQYYDENMQSTRVWDKATPTTLYAKWNGYTYTVTFDKTEGTGGTDSVIAIYGSAMPGATAPTRSSYSFLGYYDSNDVKYYNAFMQSVKVWDKTEPITLYAKWKEETIYIRINSDGIENESGNYILFGSYPQSEVTDSTLKSSLTTLAGTLPSSSNSQAWTFYDYYKSSSNSTDYMWYIDTEHNGETYRGVYFTSYRPYYTSYSSSTSNSNQDDNGYNTSTVYWFKYEPIKWRILTESSGKALLLCEMLIDSQEYDESSNNYANSNIRAWLNDNFYNTAFNDLQKQIIQLTTVDNSAASTGYSSNSYACANTNDNIFLLSYKEVTNSSYGFSSDHSTYDSARQKKTTDYAQCQGAYTNTSSDYGGNGYWWLRSPGSDYSFSAWLVDYAGYAGRNLSVANTNHGVCPALWISLG